MKNVVDSGLTTCYDILYEIPKDKTDLESIAKGMTSAWYGL
jgi:hypothetical protein